MRRRTIPRMLGGAAFAVALVAGCGGSASAAHRTTITFVQFKPEAAQYFQDLATRFEAANPDIRVVVDTVPDPETALRTRLVKGDVPDVLTLNANGTFGELASAGIFRDFRSDPALKGVNPGYLKVIGNLGTSSKGAVNGVPFAANASGILYNEQIFQQQGVAVPRTWGQLIAAAKKFQAAGITPFYGMLHDSWTAQSPLAPLTAQTLGADFFQRRFAGRTTFAKGWREALEKEGTLYRYTQPDPAAPGYTDGTRAFAEGKSAMLLLGSYAVPQIRTFAPKFTVGSFAFPATDEPAKTTLVSGVDVVITASAHGRHRAQSERFIRYLTQPGVVTAYCKAQVAIPTLTGLVNRDPALEGVRPYIDSARIVGFTDHQFIPAIPLAALLQQYLIDHDVDAMLHGLDSDWDKVAKRRTWALGAVQS